MRRFRKLVVTAGIALALLLSFAAATSADPGDPGGFADPTIQAGPNIVNIAAPGAVTITRRGTSSTAADPGDPGGFGQ